MFKHLRVGYKIVRRGSPLVIAIFIALAIYQLAAIEHLGTIQDAGAKRAPGRKKRDGCRPAPVRPQRTHQRR